MIEYVLTFLGLVGIGGIISSILNKRKELEFKILENKERRYKSCLLYMDVYFEPANIKYLSSRQPDIQSSKDIIEYLKAEYHEMILYASKEVVLSVKSFIENPTKETFLNAILEMRRDLWEKNESFSLEDIDLRGESLERNP